MSHILSWGSPVNVSGQSMLPVAALAILMLPGRAAVVAGVVIALVFGGLLLVRASATGERRALTARVTRGYRGRRRAA
ncbi:hypothetical protein J2S43_002310 [Catenuloplanes nepalensis]|uniref:Uncharacterized protein n=1 Tax=Catenuloplanes nepalensis TaxID=587533 RepID=A0ABT9MQX1_9ACTN|nr:hypothetical protein [Catenuloplanes nepalensis]MDP9793798.1 hypothetical protein [Catenuloplanes nepalensis]